MPLNVESLSNHAKTLLVASLASEVTVCARDAYEAGTDQVVRPELLRAYNELLHRVTGAVRDHLVGRAGYSLKDILEMLRRKEWKGWRNAMGFGTSDQIALRDA